MRKKFVAGNWKMYCGDPAKAVELAKGVVASVGSQAAVEAAVCPPATALAAVITACAGSQVGVGGQNLYPKDEGAFTGELSAPFLKALGCRYVILGHSERRTYFKEDDAFINLKVKAALTADLVPIFCCGETEQEREQGTTEKVVETQVRGGLAGLDVEQLGKVVVAYEPVWAIGTGVTPTPAEAEEAHGWIRARLDAAGAPRSRILYGGSVAPANIGGFLSRPGIDGVLVGGASLEAASFTALVGAARAAAAARRRP